MKPRSDSMHKNDTQAKQHQQTMLCQTIHNICYQTQVVRKATTRLLLLIKYLNAVIKTGIIFYFLSNPSVFIPLLNCILHFQDVMLKT